MPTQEVSGLERALRIYDANVSPRARTLGLYESEVDGTRFDGRPAWTDTDVPIFERRPAVIYHAVESSIQSKVDLLLGNGRFPCITAAPDEDESGSEDGLSEDDSAIVDKTIQSIIRETKLPALLRELYTTAQGCGTAVAIFGAQSGKLFGETLPAKWATCKRDESGDLTEVALEYPYIAQERINGVWTARCWLYRRVITAASDTVYSPAEAREDGTEPDWRVLSSSEHNLGFVPVQWYKHAAPMRRTEGEDGYPVHRTILSELEALHLALSMRHTGALNALPQIIEVGVEPGYNPTSPGNDGMSVQVTMTGGPPSPSNPVRGAYKTQGTHGRRGARKKGPGFPWQYESPETKVFAINTPGEALTSLDEHIRDLRGKVCETLAWVPLDPDSIKFAATVSGRALEILRERELNRVASDRETFGEQMILGSVQMLLRIAHRLGGALKTARLAQCMPILQRFSSPDGWSPLVLSLRWPAYFLPSAEDNQKTVDLGIKARESGAITLRTQVELYSRIFGIANIDAYLETLESERQERAGQEQAELAGAIAHAHSSLQNDDEADMARGRGGKPQTNPRNGSRRFGSASATEKEETQEPR